jgi:holliday junction DNA helicase RuvA
MIGRITGILESLDEMTALLAPAPPPPAPPLSPGAHGGGPTDGIAYELMIPAFLEPGLRLKIGQRITLVTFHYFDSPNQGATFIPRLIGFLSPRDRDFFELFTTVKGIGNRKALRAMALEPAKIAAAIAAKDAKGLTQLPEIGKRLAETIIAELSGKVEAYLSAGELTTLNAGAAGKPTLSTDPVMEETIDALVALGENRNEAEIVVVRTREAGKRHGKEFRSSNELLSAVYASRAR